MLVLYSQTWVNDNLQKLTTWIESILKKNFSSETEKFFRFLLISLTISHEYTFFPFLQTLKLNSSKSDTSKVQVKYWLEIGTQSLFYRTQKVRISLWVKYVDPLMFVQLKKFYCLLERFKLHLRTICFILEVFFKCWLLICYLANMYRFPSLFAVDIFHHFGLQILNSQIKSPFLTRKLTANVNKRIWR